MRKKNSLGYTPAEEEFRRTHGAAMKKEEEELLAGVRRPDYSFLEEPRGPSARGGIGRIFTRRSLVRAAVILLVFCTAVSATAIWMNSRSIDAGNSEEKTLTIDGKQTLKYMDMEDLPKARKAVPGLWAPGYVPEGYQFDFLVIEKNNISKTNYLATYMYTGATPDDRMKICVDVMKGGISSIFATDYRTVESGGRTIYVWTDVTTDMACAVMMEGDATISACALYAEDEMVRVLEEMSQE